MKTKKIPCEVFSRVVGYYRPVHNWNKGKQQEFKERVEFKEEDCLKTKVELPGHPKEVKEAKAEI